LTRLRTVLVCLVLLLAVAWPAGVLAGAKGSEFQGFPGSLGTGPLTPASQCPLYNNVTPLAVYNYNYNVGLLSQCDSQWGSISMSTCAHTICQAGCALTSTSMIFRYFLCTKHPDDLNACLGVKACPIWWAYASQTCSESKAVLYCGTTWTFDYHLMAEFLRCGWPPILELVKGTSTHWVVVRTVAGDEYSPSSYSVNDPNGGLLRNLTYFTNNGWTGHTLVAYGPR